MTCSAEQVALFVGGDLAPEESANLEHHLSTCHACSQLLASLHGDAVALHRLGPTLVSPVLRVARRRAPLRWAPAVAAVLLLIGLLAVPTVQAVDRIWNLSAKITVTDLSPEEWRAQHKTIEGPPPPPPETVESIEVVESIEGVQIARLGQVPPGYQPKEVTTYPGASLSVLQTYETFDPEISFYLLEHHSGGGVTIFAPPGDDGRKELLVNGQPAVLLTGEREHRTFRQLFFEWGGHVLVLTHIMPTDQLALHPEREFLRYAESLY